MELLKDLLLPLLIAFIASSGFWAFVSKRADRSDAERDLLIGLAHDRIVWLGMQYIERRYITQDQYENLHDYLYKPYERAGGNGSAKRVMDEVKKLPIRNHIVSAGENHEL